MPPRKKYTKEEIIDAAVDIVRENGCSGLNARSIAEKLGCSTQPIFGFFNNMDEVKDEVIKKATQIYNFYTAESASISDSPYKGTGIAYLRFAGNEKELFKLLFMRDRTKEETKKSIPDQNFENVFEYIIDTIVQKTGLSRELAAELHMHIWIYTHGLATMIATNYFNFSESEAGRLLTEEFSAIVRRYKEK